MGSKTAYESFYQNLKEVPCGFCGNNFLRTNPNRRHCSDICRFSEKVDKSSTSPCWIWLGTKNSKGYGSFRVGKKNLKAYRFSYQHYIADIPEGMMVLHSCDNPSCVNPKHLRVGTAQDNADDMTSRNRQAVKEKNARWNPNSTQHKLNPNSYFYDPS